MADVADRLRALADAAEAGGFRIEATEDAFQLIRLAPGLARGYADALDALGRLATVKQGGMDSRQFHEFLQERAGAALAEADRLLGDTA